MLCLMRGGNLRVTGPAQPPATATLLRQQNPVYDTDERYWSSIDYDTVKAVSFGLVATAVLVSMFLIMAIFERFFRRAGDRPSRASPPGGILMTTEARWDVESQPQFTNHPKIWQASSKLSHYVNGMTVLMPGEDVPTFIAQPAPRPCPLELMITGPPYPNKFDSFFSNC